MNDSEQIDKCLFCLEEIKDSWVNPKYCECKVKLHSECLSQIEGSGLFCPICRKKATDREMQILRLHILHANEPIIIWYPFSIFYRNPNFWSFAILIIWSFVVTIFYILPILVYLALFDDRYRFHVTNILLFIVGYIGWNFFPEYFNLIQIFNFYN